MVHISTAEILLHPDKDKKTLASQYHESLLPHLHAVPGFIEERRYVSSDSKDRVLILSHWEDAAAIRRWRNQPDHIPIQEEAAKGIFQEWRLRIGEVDDVEREEGTKKGKEEKGRGFMVLYFRPKKKQDGQETSTSGVDEMSSDLLSKDKAVYGAMRDLATYEDGTSILRLTGWASREDALRYEESIERVEGDQFERVRVERDYSKERREDAPSYVPGGIE